ncbi:MAG: 50S ribosomal protein L15 [bacterium]|nr:50S ribosomal protein L15 [bacterium]
MANKRNQLKLHHLRPPDGSKRKRIRVGRGESGRRGKTAGRGTKGLKARRQVRPGFEGGQTPLQIRIPQLPGFKPYKREEFTVVNVDSLTAFPAGQTVSLSLLREAGLVRKRGKVKVLGRGEMDRALTVEAHSFSGSARRKIEGAGGSCVTVG